jgi:hypothetical protein
MIAMVGFLQRRVSFVEGVVAAVWVSSFLHYSGFLTHSVRTDFEGQGGLSYMDRRDAVNPFARPRTTQQVTPYASPRYASWTASPVRISVAVPECTIRPCSRMWARAAMSSA